MAICDRHLSVREREYHYAGPVSGIICRPTSLPLTTVVGAGNGHNRLKVLIRSGRHMSTFSTRPRAYNSAAIIAAAVRTWFHIVHLFR